MTVENAFAITQLGLVLFILLSFFLCKFNRFADFLVKLHYTQLCIISRGLLLIILP